MEIIDISWQITENCTEYKTKKTVKFIHTKSFKTDGVRDSVIRLGAHTGTHVDAPTHFLQTGKTIDQLDLNSIVGDCKVLDLTNVEEKITQQDLEKFEIQKDEIILLKTKNSSIPITEKFNPNFVYLEKTGAKFFANKKVKCVGIDYLGIERAQPEHTTHKILLKHKITIIEGLRLKNATKQYYFFCCLPIFIKNLEASPARAILIEK